MKCHICSLPAHKNCIKEENINTAIGIVYLCQHCLLHKGRTDVTADDTSDKPPPPQPDVEGENHAAHHDSDSDDEEEKIKDKKKPQKKKPKDSDSEDDESESMYEITENTCKFFLKTSCKTGLLGKNCKFDHLPVCNKLMRHGIRSPQGCKLGRDCRFFHPHMCRESLKFKTCSRSNCKYYHVKGTVQSDGYSPEQYAPEEAAPQQRFTQTFPQQEHRVENPRGHETVRRENPDFLDVLRKLEGHIVNIQQQLSHQQKQIQQLPAATVQYRQVPQMATIQTQPLNSMSQQAQPNQYIQQYPLIKI